MDDKLLTIKEFAEAAGISKQAVYKQLDNKLTTFVVIVDNKKMLKQKALKEVYDIEVSTKSKPVEQQVNNQVENIFNQNQQLIDMLREELAEKNKQITELNARLEEAQRLINQQQQLQLANLKMLEGVTGQPEPEKQERPEQKPEKKSWLQRLFG